MRNRSIFIFLAIVLLLHVCSCQEATENKLEVEYGSLFFDSVDRLCQAIRDPSSCDAYNQQLLVENSFEELAVDYYPQITDDSFYLLTIEVNKYNIFYYYVPLGTGSFSHDNGLVVTVPRENEATLDNVKKQFPSAIEAGSSIFVNELHSWFIPIGHSYYEISYPSSMVDCEQNIVKMIPIDSNS